MTEKLLNCMKNLQYEVVGGNISEYISFEKMMLYICDNYKDGNIYSIFENIYKDERYLGITQVIMPTVTIIALSDTLDINLSELFMDDNIDVDMTDYIKQYRRRLNISKL